MNIVIDDNIFEGLLGRFRPGFDRFKSAAREIRLALWDNYDTGECGIVLERAGTGESTARAGRRRGGKLVKTLGAGDVRIGVSNWKAFVNLEVFGGLGWVGEGCHRG